MRVTSNKISREIKYNIDPVVKPCICGHIFSVQMEQNVHLREVYGKIENSPKEYYRCTPNFHSASKLT